MHAKNWCTVYCVLVSNLWFYFPLWCHWKRKWLDLLMEISAVTALAERWKVKLSFQAKAFQLTMRTDFPFSVHHLRSLVARDAIYCPERMALPRKDQNSSSVPARNFNIHKPVVSISWEEIAWYLSTNVNLSLLPKVFGPIFNIRFCWKSLTYKILSGLLECILVCLLVIQANYEMWGFLSMCPTGCVLVNHFFADPYRTGQFFTILVKSSGTFLDVTSALKGEGRGARCWEVV